MRCESGDHCKWQAFEEAMGCNKGKSKAATGRSYQNQGEVSRGSTVYRRITRTLAAHTRGQNRCTVMLSIERACNDAHFASPPWRRWREKAGRSEGVECTALGKVREHFLAASTCLRASVEARLHRRLPNGWASLDPTPSPDTRTQYNSAVPRRPAKHAHVSTHLLRHRSCLISVRTGPHALPWWLAGTQAAACSASSPAPI